MQLKIGEQINLASYPNDRRLHNKCTKGTGQIYKITPLLSQSKSTGYVGLNTTSLADRLSNHFSPNNKCIALRNALQRYGRSNFVIELLQVDVPLGDLLESEKLCVSEHDTYKRGYNCTPGGESNPMNDPNIRKKHKEIVSNPEFVAKATAKRMVTFALPEIKVKKSQGMKEAWRRGEFRAQHKESEKAAWKNDDSRRANVSSRSTKQWNDANERDRIVKLQKEAHKRPEVKANKSKESKRRWEDPIWAASMKLKLAAGRKRRKEIKNSTH